MQRMNYAMLPEQKCKKQTKQPSKQTNTRTESNNFRAYPPLLMSLFLTWLPNVITQVKFGKIKFASFDNTLTFAN